MKGHSLWSYDPYTPPLFNSGDIYICRVVPYVNSIHFEWKSNSEESFEVYYRKRDNGEFIHYTDTDKNECDIINLDTDTDYEFYVASGDKKSRVRLVRCGESIGTVVNYLHPDDKAYVFSGQYLCSPSLLKHPDGYLLSSMDIYGDDSPQNLTIIFRSDDDGKSWHHLTELMPCFWGEMFMHNGDIYMVSCSTEGGDILIGKSSDGGKTFSAPVALLRGSNCKQGMSGGHKSPMRAFVHNGRIYIAAEWGSWVKDKGYYHAAMVMSCDINDDLLIAENWSFSEPKIFEKSALELMDVELPASTIEGSIVLAPDGKLLNVMRFSKRGYAIKYEIDQKNPETQLKYDGLIKPNVGESKFEIQYDSVSNRYYTIASHMYEGSDNWGRNLLCLISSPDLENWEVLDTIIDYRHEDWQKFGFQYVDFLFDGDDIIFLCRTAMNNAHTFHDTNYQTFHRIENFRELVK